MPLQGRPLSLGSHRLHRDLALLVLVVSASAIPFLRQPFHMDDGFYMDMARNVKFKPLYPNDQPYIFEGHALPDMGSHSHPPLPTYFLAAMQGLFGEGQGREWLYHTCALLFPLFAVTAFYFLCGRFVQRPLWPALLLAACPLFLVSQHTLMADIPTLAFWLGAISAFLYAADRRSSRLFALSSVFQFAAMFCSYQAFSLTPLLGFYQARKRGGLRGWISLLIPIGLMAAWFILNYHHYHRMLLVDTLGYMKSRDVGSLASIVHKLIAVIGYQGWLIIFPAFLLYAWGRGLRGRLAGLVLIGAMYLTQIVAPNYRLYEKMILVTGLVGGFFVILQMGELFLTAVRYKTTAFGLEPLEGQFLGLWFFGVFFYCIFVLTEGSARYILPLIPPVLICYCLWLELSEIAEYRTPAVPILNSAMMASGSLVFSMSLGLLLSHADLEFARVYERASVEFRSISGGMNSYFAGEWGFRYYFHQAGARLLPQDDSSVEAGSWLAWPKLALPYDRPKPLMSMAMPVQTLVYQPRTPLRLIDRQCNAGFYSTGWGLLPFSFSRKPLEEIEVYQINFMVESLPGARVIHGGSIAPWPGFLNLPGRSPLALLLKPGTTIQYAWKEKKAVELDLLCGVGLDAYSPGASRRFYFAVVQRNRDGVVMTESRLTLDPGLQPSDRQWQPVHLSLGSGSEGNCLLEFSCDSEDPSAMGTVGFAEAVLRRPLS